MSKIKKCYKIIMIILMISILLCSNKVFAKTDAEKAYEDFMKSENAAEHWNKIAETILYGSIDDLTDQELDIVIGADYWVSDLGGAYTGSETVKSLQDSAIKEKENRAQGGTQSGGSSAEKAEKRKQLEKEIRDFCSQNLSNVSTDAIRGCLYKINQYKTVYDGTDQMIVGYYYNLLNDQLETRGEERDTTLTTNHVGSNGEVESSGPSTGLLGNADASASHTPDEIINEANNFLNQGSTSPTINGDNLKQASSTLYNILLSIGIFLAVAIGIYLGVKFMLSTAEDKAKVKEALIPYIAGCIIIFTAFIIWKVAILLLGGIG